MVHTNSTTGQITLGIVNSLQRSSSPSKYIAVPAPRPKVVKATVRSVVVSSNDCVLHPTNQIIYTIDSHSYIYINFFMEYSFFLFF